MAILTDVVAAEAKATLYELHGDHAQCFRILCIATQGQRGKGVFANARLAKGTVTLVPFSTQVGFSKPGEDATQQCGGDWLGAGARQ